MALKFTVKDISSLDEATQKLYTKNGEAYVLDVEGAVSDDDHNKLKEDLVASNEENRRRRQTVESFKKLGDTPEEIQAKIDEAGKTGNKDLDALKAEHNQIIEQMKAGHAAEVAAERDKRLGLVKGSQADKLRAELASAGVVPDGLDLVAKVGQDRIKIGDDDRITILKADGKTPMVGSGEGGEATVSDLAKELTAAYPRLVADDGKGGIGKDPAAKSGDKSTKTVTRDQFDAMSHEDRSAFSIDGGKVV